MAWHRCASLQDIWPGVTLPVQIGKESIALYNIADEVYATSNICTHEQAWLSDGYLDGDCIECPLHGALFHVPSGEARSGIAPVNLKTFPVRIEGPDVFIDVGTADGTPCT